MEEPRYQTNPPRNEDQQKKPAEALTTFLTITAHALCVCKTTKILSFNLASTTNNACYGWLPELAEINTAHEGIAKLT